MRWTALSMLLAAAGLAVPGPAAAADWPQYRGPERDGVSAEEPIWITSGRSSGPTRRLGVIRTSRSITLRSSRTLPGHA